MTINNTVSEKILSSDNEQIIHVKNMDESHKQMLSKKDKNKKLCMFLLHKV